MKIEEKIKAAQENLNKLIATKNKQLSNKTIPCSSCGFVHKIRDITLLDKQYYVEPSGCSGGDYYDHDEYNFVCENCRILNRLLFDHYHLEWPHGRKFENSFFAIYKLLFKRVEMFYPQDVRQHSRWSNNKFISDNIKKFVAIEDLIKLNKFIKNPERHYK